MSVCVGDGEIIEDAELYIEVLNYRDVGLRMKC